MASPTLSVIIPALGRAERLRETLATLARQRGLDRAEFELVVVSDGSLPASEIVRVAGDGTVIVDRTPEEGRSVARNRGAENARGDLVMFVDNDMVVSPTFLNTHLQAHAEWPGSLQIGRVRLTAEALATPFGRFRQRLEDEGMPERAGPINSRVFGTAQNMAIERGVFERLGGFDPTLDGAEDLELALRHVRAGGRLIFVPAAKAIHDDDSGLDLESYCRRAETYMAALFRFGTLYPKLPESVERATVNGPVRWGGDPISLSGKKLLKIALVSAPIRSTALALVSLIERIGPDSRLLDWLYRVMLGAHLQRGYRRGLRDADG